MRDIIRKGNTHANELPLLKPTTCVGIEEETHHLKVDAPKVFVFVPLK